jgi:hypothetical protein
MYVQSYMRPHNKVAVEHAQTVAGIQFTAQVPLYPTCQPTCTQNHCTALARKEKGGVSVENDSQTSPRLHHLAQASPRLTRPPASGLYSSLWVFAPMVKRLIDRPGPDSRPQTTRYRYRRIFSISSLGLELHFCLI